ncbi:MAG: HD domain-containing protein [Thermotogota bacterium]
MNKNEAIKELEHNLKENNLRKHCYAVGAIMRELALKMGKDPDEWEIAGIIHDLDYEMTKDEVEQHAKKTVEMLGDRVDQDIKDAILAHNDQKHLEKDIEIALYAADQISGLITASVLVRPGKDIDTLKVKSLKKKFKDKSFAAGADREKIKVIEKLGFELNDFFQIAINGMRKEKELLGLDGQSE